MILTKRNLELSLIFWCATTALPAVGKDSGLMLCQSSGVCGKAEIYASSNGLKLVQKSTNCALIMKAPDWKVSYFNTNSKVMFETNANNWQGKSSGYFAGLVSASRFLALCQGRTKIDAKSIFGLHCNETQLVRIGTLPPDTIRFKNELKAATYFGTSDLHLPPQAVLVLQRFYRIPTLKGFPIRVIVIDLKGRLKNELDTTSCVKAAFASSTFAVPSNYRKVATEEAVLASHQQGLLQDMSDDLGSSLGSH